MFLKYLILIALFSHSALSKETPRERAKKLASKIYGTCHGGKPEKVSKLYLNNECRKIEDEDFLFVLGKEKFQKIKYTELKPYVDAKVPESMQDGIQFNGTVKIYEADKNELFWSPALVGIEPLINLKKVVNHQNKMANYNKMKLDEVKKYKGIVAIDPPSFGFEGRYKVKINDQDEIDSCMNYFFKGFEIIKCTKTLEGDFIEALLFGKNIVYSAMGGGNATLDISPAYEFEYDGVNYIVFTTYGDSKKPILVFRDGNGGYGYEEIYNFCPHMSGDPCF